MKKVLAKVNMENGFITLLMRPVILDIVFTNYELGKRFSEILKDAGIPWDAIKYGNTPKEDKWYWIAVNLDKLGGIAPEQLSGVFKRILADFAELVDGRMSFVEKVRDLIQKDDLLTCKGVKVED